MRTAPSLEALALRWLSQREHSRVELRGKLMRTVTLRAAAAASVATSTADSSLRRPSSEAAATRVSAAGEIDGLLDRLVERGYLDDARFMESRVRARSATAGHRRIALELRRHGVPLSKDAEQALLDSEFARASALWNRRFGGRVDDAAADPREAARQMRLLIARGFAPEVVRLVLKRARCGEPDDLLAPD